MRSPQRVSGLDASFFSLETATQPLQVFSVFELDTSTIPGGYSYDCFRAALATRLRAIPVFREKVSDNALNLDFPAWVQDTDFDIDRHVHRIGVPAPGGRAEFEELCGYLATLRLDHGRPLWAMWVIEGRDDGRLAVLLMLHHAIADGLTLADIIGQLCSTEPDPPPPAFVEAAPAAGPLRIAVTGLAGFARRPWYLLKLLPASITAVIDTIRRAATGRAMAAPFTAPRTVLNGKLTSDRKLAFAQLDLADVKKVANHFGVKINDVVMAIVGGQARELFLNRGELPKASLVALVPVSAHGPSDRTGRNQVSGMYPKLQTQITDPVERLKSIAVANVIAKEHSSAIGVTLLQDWGDVIGPVLLGIAKRVYAWLTQLRPMYNIVVSNVPGPHAPYLLGAEVSALYACGPVMHGAGLNVTLWSANGTLYIAVLSCPALLLDPRTLADGFAAGLTEMLDQIS
ncbi:wax ester/triacylglycerol synthase family O-acyltransferase [Mycobacterium sp. 155]|uniref:WS/DGAT/MGAT family O-acyltransferase n=1 Tax=Mycobacterium sp. 155 TaxID=1157943 RepID=UPI000688FD66|nr:wax ester/triacylglycerol synthase family O-acyltransferase [Mycobacterium sp. 155]